MQKIIRKINERIGNAERILIFSHAMPDGDALGSSTALCRSLRLCGKQAYVVTEEELAHNLRFLDAGGYCVRTDGSEPPKEFFESVFAGESADLGLMVDCGDYSRIEKRADLFKAIPYTICVDHHKSSKGVADLNMIAPEYAATGEPVYLILRDLEDMTGKILIDEEVCEAIYAAIATDTGNFQYSNATSETHRIVMEMMQRGFDHNKVCVQIYQSNTLPSLMVKSAIIGKMRLFAGGKAAVSYVTQDMLAQVGASLDETEDAVDELRNIIGVEVAIFLKELEDGRIKASLRSKNKFNVMRIASAFGGGGHIKAAGCTFFDTDIKAVCTQMIEAVTKALAEEKA